MKKILRLLCILPIILLLFGCDIGDFGEDEDTKTVVEAEVVIWIGGGMYNVHPDQQEWLSGVGIYERGSNVTLTINIPEDSQYSFVGWYISDTDFWRNYDPISTDLSYSFKAEVDSYTGIKARVEKSVVRLDYSSTGGGKVEGYDNGEFSTVKPKTLTATPFVGYSFDGWYADNKLLSTDEVFDFVATKDMKLLETRFIVDPRMDDFNFRSDGNKCIILGVKDKNIKNVTIPRYVDEIGEGAFSNCYNISFIELPRNVERIGVNAFYHCENLTSIVLPKKVSFIGYDAFGNTNSLEKIYYNGKISDFEQIEFENNYDLDDNLIYYYSATEPTDSGNYWHFVDNVPTIWENE